MCSFCRGLGDRFEQLDEWLLAEVPRHAERGRVEALVVDVPLADNSKKKAKLAAL
jgi:hypothetical protein